LINSGIASVTQRVMALISMSHLQMWRIIRSPTAVVRAAIFGVKELWPLLFVCVRSERILHHAVVFDRERRYGPKPPTSILSYFSVRVALP